MVWRRRLADPRLLEAWRPAMRRVLVDELEVSVMLNTEAITAK